MERRQMLAGLAVTALAGLEGQSPATASSTFLEIKSWYLHNSAEGQEARLAEFLESGLFPALNRAGVTPVGAFANLIGPSGPFYVTVTQYTSLGLFQDAVTKVAGDQAYQQASQKLSSGSGLPFVRLESNLLRSFTGFPEAKLSPAPAGRQPRIFEMRTYESQSLTSLVRKVNMFDGGEIAIFERLNMRPVFFGETIVGGRQPCLTYMLSFDDLGAREKLWREFGSDPEWKKLSAPPPLHDSEIVANISNVILRPLPFSPTR